MKKTRLNRRKPLRSKVGLKRSKLASKARKPLSRKRTPKRNKDGSLAKSERIRRLKKKLWVIFSKYIRAKHADHTGWLNTCDGVRTTWKECDCGHLWHNSERNASLGGNELWYYEKNFYPQSNQGNRLNADDSAQKYMLFAVKLHGQAEIDRMWKMKQTYKLWTEEELEALYQHYKEAFEALNVYGK